jgi:hypothetical protein
LGVSGYLPIPKETLIESVKALVPQKTIEVNMRAFEMGRRKVEGELSFFYLLLWMYEGLPAGAYLI